MDRICFGYLKFGKRIWVERFAYGELSFSCAGKYISDYQCTGDEARGDRLEAVFAHVPKSDPRVEQCKSRFESDLEIINDGNDVFLRRRSSSLIPVFCLLV